MKISFERLYNTQILRDLYPAPFKGRYPTRVFVRYWMFGRKYEYVGVPQTRTLQQALKRLQTGVCRTFQFAEFDRTGIVGLIHLHGRQLSGRHITDSRSNPRKAMYYHYGTRATASWWQLAWMEVKPLTLPNGRTIYWDPSQLGRPSEERMQKYGAILVEQEPEI